MMRRNRCSDRKERLLAWRGAIIFMMLFVLLLPAAQAASPAKPSKEQQAMEQAELGAAAIASGDFLEAAACYAKALKLAPKVDAYLIGSGDALMGQGDAKKALAAYQKALAAYQKALKLAPDNVDALRGIGNAQNTLKKYEKALEAFNTLLVLLPEDASAHRGRGMALEGLERVEEAIQAYNKAIALDPEDLVARNACGALLIGKEHYDAALIVLDYAVLHESDNPVYLQNRSIALRNLYLLDEALDDIERAVALAPTQATFYRTLGHVYYFMEDYGAAAVAYRRGIALCLKSEKGSYEYALNTMLQEISDVISKEYVLSEADDLEKKGMLEGIQVKELLPPPDNRIAPSTINPKEQFALGEELSDWNHRDITGALVAFNRAIAAGLTDYEVYYGRAEALDSLMRYDDAARAFSLAIEHISPGDSEARTKKADCLNRRALSLYCLARYETALKAVDQAIKLDKDGYYSTYMYTRDDILVLLGRSDEVDVHNEYYMPLGCPEEDEDGNGEDDYEQMKRLLGDDFAGDEDELD